MSDNELLGGAVIMSVALFTLCGFSFSSLLFLYLYHSLLLFCLSPSFLSRLWSGCTVISQHCRLHLRVMTHTLLCTRSPFPAFLCVRTRTHTCTHAQCKAHCCVTCFRCALYRFLRMLILHTHTHTVNVFVLMCRDEPLTNTLPAHWIHRLICMQKLHGCRGWVVFV